MGKLFSKARKTEITQHLQVLRNIRYLGLKTQTSILHIFCNQQSLSQLFGRVLGNCKGQFTRTSASLSLMRKDCCWSKSCVPNPFFRTYFLPSFALDLWERKRFVIDLYSMHKLPGFLASQAPTHKSSLRTNIQAYNSLSRRQPEVNSPKTCPLVCPSKLWILQCLS